MRVHQQLMIDRRAAAQLGLISRQQLLDAGISRSMIGRRVGAGLLIPSGHRMFRVAAAPATWECEVLAACLDLDAVASHWTAAALHGFGERRRMIDVTVVEGSGNRPWASGRRASVRVHTTTSLPVEDRHLVGAIPVTSVARTALGLAALVPGEITRDALVELVSAAVDRGQATDPWLWWLLERRRCRGRNGVAMFESVLAERAQLGPTESWLERQVLAVIGAAGLRLPMTQEVIARSGRFVARVDFVYEPERVVLEALGYAHHRTPAESEADTRRANELQLLGYEVLQFTTRQIVGSPASVQETISRALGGTGEAAVAEAG